MNAQNAKGAVRRQ